MSIYKRTFDATSELGSDGERLVREYYLKQGFEVTDLSDDENWRASDVDMMIRKDGGEPLYMEVKSDTETWRTLNIFLELSMERRNSNIISEGWLLYSLADYLVYVCAGTGKMYVMDFEKLREYVRKGIGRFIVFDNPIDDNCIGRGILVSIKNLKEAGLIEHETVLNNSDFWKYNWKKPIPF